MHCIYWAFVQYKVFPDFFFFPLLLSMLVVWINFPFQFKPHVGELYCKNDILASEKISWIWPTRSNISFCFLGSFAHFKLWISFFYWQTIWLPYWKEMLKIGGRVGGGWFASKTCQALKWVKKCQEIQCSNRNLTKFKIFWLAKMSFLCSANCRTLTWFEFCQWNY